MVELGGMVAVPVGWQADGDLGGNGQPLDDTAVVVMGDTDDLGIASRKTLRRGATSLKRRHLCFWGYPTCGTI